MALQTINIGASANDGTGDPLRSAMDKINDNFLALYYKTKTFTATAGNSFAAGEIGYLTTANTVTKADADAQASTAAFLVMANEAIAAGQSGSFVMPGGIWVTSGLTPSTLYYASQTAGAITTTAPTAAGTYVRQIGIAISATELLFDPGEITNLNE